MCCFLIFSLSRAHVEFSLIAATIFTEFEPSPLRWLLIIVIVVKENKQKKTTLTILPFVVHLLWFYSLKWSKNRKWVSFLCFQRLWVVRVQVSFLCCRQYLSDFRRSQVLTWSHSIVQGDEWIETHEKYPDLQVIPHFRGPQTPSDKLRPARQIFLGRKVPLKPNLNHFLTHSARQLQVNWFAPYYGYSMRNYISFQLRTSIPSLRFLSKLKSLTNISRIRIRGTWLCS